MMKDPGMEGTRRGEAGVGVDGSAGFGNF